MYGAGLVVNQVARCCPVSMSRSANSRYLRAQREEIRARRVGKEGPRGRVEEDRVLGAQLEDAGRHLPPRGGREPLPLPQQELIGARGRGASAAESAEVLRDICALRRELDELEEDKRRIEARIKLKSECLAQIIRDSGRRLGL